MSRSVNRLSLSGLGGDKKGGDSSQASSSSNLSKYMKKSTKNAVARPNRFESGKINFASIIGDVTYADDAINDGAEESKMPKKEVEISYEIVDSGNQSNLQASEKLTEQSYVICSDNASGTETSE